MKSWISYLRNRVRARQKKEIIANFYSKKMNRGKTVKADFFDKLSSVLVLGIVLLIFFTRLIDNIVVGIIASTIAIVGLSIYLVRVDKKSKQRKIEKIKADYKEKLEKEQLLKENQTVEDYILQKYYDNKKEIKANLSFFNSDKIFKLYFLFIVFYITAFFSNYPKYYKIMGIVCFILATFIWSYNLTEYIRKKDKKSIYNKDLEV